MVSFTGLCKQSKLWKVLVFGNVKDIMFKNRVNECMENGETIFNILEFIAKDSLEN